MGVVLLLKLEGQNTFSKVFLIRKGSTDLLFLPSLFRVSKHRKSGRSALCVHLAVARLISEQHSMRMGKASLANAPQENGVLVLVPQSGT